MQIDQPMTENESPIPTAGNKMPEVTEQLPHLPFEVRRTARVLADVVGMTDWAVGKSPKAVAASCVYLADLVHDRDDRLSQMEIDRRGIVSNLTIRNQYREIPRLFLKHADDEQLQRLGDTDEEIEYVVQTLEFFDEKNEEGYAIDGLKWRPEGGSDV